MSKFILFTNGILSARYDSAINSTIPDEAIEVDDALFFQTINENDCVWSLVDGVVVKKPIEIKPETPEQIIARLEGAIDRYLDAQAQSFRYESIRTMVTYENDPNPKFNAEGVGAKEFRSAVYTLGVNLIGEVQSGLREVPTEAELLALMPKLEDFVTY